MKLKLLIISLIIIYAQYLVYPNSLEYYSNNDSTHYYLLKSQESYEAGDDIKAIELIEIAYLSGEVKYNYKYGIFTTEEYMKSLYTKAKKEKQGAEFLYKYFTSLPESIRLPFKFEDVLFDLSLMSKYFVPAERLMEVDRKKGEDYIDYEKLARLNAIKGNTGQSLNDLKMLINNRVYLSKNQILVRPEFVVLYDNPEFQSMMAEESSYKKWKNITQNEFEYSISIENVKKAAESYRKMDSGAAPDSIEKELEKSDEFINFCLDSLKDEILKLFINEKNYNYYKLSLAMQIAKMGDPVINSLIINNIPDTAFTGYPNQKYFLTLYLVRTNPQEAKTLVLSLLKSANGGYFSSVHVIGYSWNMMLTQILVISDGAYRDVLLEMCESPDTNISHLAEGVLMLTSDPIIADIAVQRYINAKTAFEKNKYLNLLVTINTPQSRQAIEELKNKMDETEKNIIITAENNLKQNQEYVLTQIQNGDYIEICHPKIKKIFFENLIKNWGTDISFMPGTIYHTFKKEDLPMLIKARNSVLNRFSDEAMYDWQILNAIYQIKINE